MRALRHPVNIFKLNIPGQVLIKPEYQPVFLLFKVGISIKMGYEITGMHAGISTATSRKGCFLLQQY